MKELLKEEDFILMINEISYELDVLDGKLEVIEIDKVIIAIFCLVTAVCL